MMNFDTPKREGPKINPDGSIEYESPTEAEIQQMNTAIEAGRRINMERGGSGRILSAQEKARGWFGNPETEASSEWAAGLEMQPESKPKSAADIQEDSIAALVRQMEDITKKQAEVVRQLMMTDDEGEKARLHKLEQTLQEGYELKKKEYGRVSDGVTPKTETAKTEMI